MVPDGHLVQFSACGCSVRVLVERPELARAVRAVWFPALTEGGRAHQTSDPETDGETFGPAAGGDYRYELAGGGVFFEGKLVARTEDPWDLLAHLERHLLDQLAERYADCVLLHSGIVVADVGLVLFLGPSGAGKSTLTRAAVAGGCRYVTDDFAVLRDGRLWGACRSIQFDAVGPEERPGYLSGCDVGTYLVRRGDNLLAVPLFLPDAPGLPSVALADLPIHVCLLQRSQENAVRPAAGLEKLTALHEATLAGGASYSGSLDSAFGWELRYCDPAAAFSMLLSVLSRAIALAGGQVGISRRP